MVYPPTIKKNKRWLMVALLSLMLPFYIHIPILVCTLIILMPSYKETIFNVLKSQPTFLTFFMLNAGTSLFYRNWLGAAASLAFLFVSIFFIIYNQIVTPKLFYQIIHRLFLTSGLVVLWELFNYRRYLIQHNETWQYVFTSPNPYYRAQASFVNANYYGLICIFMVLIGMYLLFKTHSVKKKLLYLSIIALNILGMIMTASRMFIPTLFIGVAIFSFFKSPRLARRSFLVACLVIGFILLNPSWLPRMQSISYGIEDRLSIWKVGWKIFQLNPLLGKGAFSYRTNYYLFTNKGLMHSHQLLIDILANYGLIGLFLLWDSLIPLTRKVTRLYRRPVARLETGLIISVILCVLIHSIVDVSIVWLQTSFILLLIISAPESVYLELESLQID
ncbi:O-antigen ligase family protein [Dolosicoccus paucivorans]